MALARPWIFAQWTGGFVPDQETYPKCAHRMLDLLAHYYEPVNALRRFRKWIVYFAANFVYGHQFSSKVRRAKDMDAARREIDAFFASDAARGSDPNRNLLQ
jgi:tRNA-dihydrouridine synthase